jgi:lycopene beta-cyclase
MQKEYDLIVVGGGASGLSLLHYLREYNHSLSILLVEPNPKGLEEKTWCFWFKDAPPLPHLVMYQWDQLEIGLPDQQINRKLDPYRYGCVKGVDFKRDLWSSASSDPHCTILTEPVQQLDSNDEHAWITTDSGTYSAPIILQSAFIPPQSSDPRYPVWQHFLGWELETESACFDPDCPVFMDFSASQNEELGFMYVLPWSNTEALVEYTVFSDTLWETKQYEKHLHPYLKQRYGLSPSDYTRKRTEFGKIPMMDRAFPTWYDDYKRIYNLGGMAGLTKASTGYTFLNIQRQTHWVADALVQGTPLPVQVGSGRRYRAYDLLLLDVIQRQPQYAESVFQHLFTCNPMDRILRFLDEESTLSEELLIMGNMPYIPFFKGIARNFGRFVSGQF